MTGQSSVDAMRNSWRMAPCLDADGFLCGAAAGPAIEIIDTTTVSLATQ